jgi:hypothetical protein
MTEKKEADVEALNQKLSIAQAQGTITKGDLDAANDQLVRANMLLAEKKQEVVAMQAQVDQAQKNEAAATAALVDINDGDRKMLGTDEATADKKKRFEESIKRIETQVQRKTALMTKAKTTVGEAKQLEADIVELNSRLSIIKQNLVDLKTKAAAAIPLPPGQDDDEDMASQPTQAADDDDNVRDLNMSSSSAATSSAPATLPPGPQVGTDIDTALTPGAPTGAMAVDGVPAAASYVDNLERPTVAPAPVVEGDAPMSEEQRWEAFFTKLKADIDAQSEPQGKYNFLASAADALLPTARNLDEFKAYVQKMMILFNAISPLPNDRQTALMAALFGANTPQAAFSALEAVAAAVRASFSGSVTIGAPASASSSDVVAVDGVPFYYGTDERLKELHDSYRKAKTMHDKNQAEIVATKDELDKTPTKDLDAHVHRKELNTKLRALELAKKDLKSKLNKAKGLFDQRNRGTDI